MTTYFSASSLDELRKEYRRLALANHPDKHPDEVKKYTAIMQEIIAEYELLLEKFLSAKYSGEKLEAEFAADEEMRAAFEAVQNISGIIIEIVGNWLWITGKTRENKEDLKAAKFRFSPKKTAWYWRPSNYVKRSRKQYTLNEIRDMFGSKVLKNNTADDEKKKIKAA